MAYDYNMSGMLIFDLFHVVANVACARPLALK
jgi:hypothetical protein